MSYLTFAILCGIIPVVFVACFFMMPESPYHLLKIGKREEAIKALAWLRCKSPASVQKEADEMQVCNGKLIKKKKKDPRVVQKRCRCRPLNSISARYRLFPCAVETRTISASTRRKGHVDRERSSYIRSTCLNVATPTKMTVVMRDEIERGLEIFSGALNGPGAIALGIIVIR